MASSALFAHTSGDGPGSVAVVGGNQRHFLEIVVEALHLHTFWFVMATLMIVGVFAKIGFEARATANTIARHAEISPGDLVLDNVSTPLCLIATARST
jgi:hypothetical protein